jgi:hypothetical protein
MASSIADQMRHAGHFRRAESFRFDIGHVAYRAVCGKVGDDDDPFGASVSIVNRVAKPQA